MYNSIWLYITTWLCVGTLLHRARALGFYRSRCRSFPELDGAFLTCVVRGGVRHCGVRVFRVALTAEPSRIQAVRVCRMSAGQLSPVLACLGLRFATRTERIWRDDIIDDSMSFQRLLEKTSDADPLQQMFGYTADRMLALEVRALSEEPPRRARRAHPIDTGPLAAIVRAARRPCAAARVLPPARAR